MPPQSNENRIVTYEGSTPLEDVLEYVYCKMMQQFLFTTAAELYEKKKA